MKKLSFFVLTSLLCSTMLQAQWTNDLTQNTPVCSTTGKQVDIDIIADGNDGVIITWEDNRINTNDVYVQRMDNGGTQQWGVNGKAVTSGTFLQENPAIIGDGNNGAIVVWQDRDASSGGRFDIIGQRYNGSGAAQWGATGKVINDYTSAQALFNSKKNPALGFDGTHVYVTFQDQRNSKDDVFGQKVDLSGNLQWNADGVEVYAGAGDKSNMKIIPDNNGGMTSLFQDDDTFLGPALFYQQNDNSGAAQYSPTPQINDFFENSKGYTVVSDGSGGFVTVWAQDNNSMNQINLFLQHVDNTGASQWGGGSNPTLLSTTANAPANPQMIAVGNDFIVVWSDSRNGDKDIFAQKFNNSGTAQWTADGITVFAGTGDQVTPQIVSDGAGGAFISWIDESTTDGVDAARIDGNGSMVWAGKSSVSTASGDKNELKIMATSDGFIATWVDYRNGAGDPDIYAQKIMADGTAPAGVTPPTAAFTFNATNLDVQFTDASTDSPDTWEWNFGDGSAVDNNQNASHTYSTGGTYTVCLTASNAGGSDSSCQMITVAAGGSAPVANFTVSVNGMTATFTDGSTNTPDAWAWDFDDGNTDNTQNPSHTFDSAGVYNVCLTASNAFGSDNSCQDVTIQDSSVSILNLKGDMAFEIFPNPAKDKVLIQLPTHHTQGTLVVMDQAGRTLRTQTIKGENRVSLDVSSLANGHYLLQYRSETNAPVHTKLIIMH